MARTELDLSGLKCPLPALMTRKALRTLAIGDCLAVRCTDPLAAIDIPALVQQGGDRVARFERHGGVLVFVIEKQSAAPATPE